MEKQTALPQLQEIRPIMTPVLFVTGFIRWWYIDAVTSHLRFFKRLVELAYDRLSIGLLLKTFFVPWHRDRSGIGIAFGIIMRILWLPIAFFLLFVFIAIGFGFIAGWLLLPIITIYNIIFFWI